MTNPVVLAKVKCTSPKGITPVLGFNVAVKMGCSPTSIGLIELVSVVVVETSCAGTAAATSRADTARPASASTHRGAIRSAERRVGGGQVAVWPAPVSPPV